MSNSSTISLEEIKANVAQAVAAQRAMREARQRARGGLPPASNTGGKLASLPASRAAGACHLDTLTFSMPVEHLGADDVLVLMHDADGIGTKVEDIFFHGLGLYMGEASGRRINGYHDSAPLLAYAHDLEAARNANLGYVAWGGNRNKAGQDTMTVHLTGEGCEHLNCLDAQGERVWSMLVDVLTDFGCKITRMDIAYDDLDGSRGGIGAAVGWYRAGGFAFRHGRPPSINQVGDWINGKGRTFYVGKRANGKLLRVYEKGHQLGDFDSGWTRYELELRSTSRVLEPAYLLQLDEILAGSYPAMAWVAEVPPMTVPTIVKARLSVSLDHLTHYARIAYGRLINVMAGLGSAPEELIASLRVDGLPRRLSLPPALYAPSA